jgi:Ca2+-binding RTX toxin-like protein
MNETMDAATTERHKWGRRLLLFGGAVGMLLLLSNVGSEAKAGTAIRSCNVFVCDEVLFFDGAPGEVNEIQTALGQRLGEGRYYWIGDENNVIRLGAAEGAAHNGCEHPPAGDRSEFPDLPRSHVVRCRWGGDGAVSFDLGDRNDVAFIAGGSRGSGYGGRGNDIIAAGWVLDGGPGNDSLIGEDRRQILKGGDGADLLNGRYGPDDLRGGDGFDTVTYDTEEGGSVRVTIGSGNQNDGGRCDEVEVTPGGCDGPSFHRADDVAGDIEKVIGSRWNDTLTGDDGPNELEGLEGDDRIRGAGGNDILRGGGTLPTTGGTLHFGGVNDLDGGDGHDVLIGGIDSDSLLGGPGNDDLSGDQSGLFEATDFLNGGGGNDLLNGGALPNLEDGAPSMDLITGGTGLDTVDYSKRTQDLSITLDGINNDGATEDGKPGEQDGVSSDVENVLGGSGNDVLSGSPIDNRLDGNEGDDVLIGDMGADDFFGGEGLDTVSFADRSKPVRVTIDDFPDDGEVFLVDDRETSEGDNVRVDVETLLGGSGNDALNGAKSPAATIFGGLGDDFVAGGGGPDYLDGEGGDDSIYALDTVLDEIFGGDGNDSAQVDDIDSVTDVETFI